MERGNSTNAEIESLLAKVGRVVADVTGIAAEPTADLSSLGIDSMKMLEILAALEDEFGIGVSENMVREFRSVDRIVRIIKDMVGAAER